MVILKCYNGEEIKLSDEKYIKASKNIWHVRFSKGVPCIYTYISGDFIRLTAFLFGIDSKKEVYNKNKDYFDFTDENVLIVDRGIYRFLTGGSDDKISKYAGVLKSRNGSKAWSAYVPKYTNISGNISIIYKGRYETEYEAAVVVDYHILQLFKDIKPINGDFTYEDIENEYNKILLKYGHDYNETIAKSLQGSKKEFKKNKSSQYVGVSYSKVVKMWHAYINYNSKRIHIGYFTEEVQAAKEYDKKAKLLYGEYAKLNFPDPEPSSTCHS